MTDVWCGVSVGECIDLEEAAIRAELEDCEASFGRTLSWDERWVILEQGIELEQPRWVRVAFEYWLDHAV